MKTLTEGLAEKLVKTWKERRRLLGADDMVLEMQAQIDELLSELSMRDAEIERLNSQIHTCGPTCAKAGCINARQNKEIEQLTETSIWQAGRISELLDAVAAQRKVLEMARRSLMASTFYTDDGHPLSESDVERHEIITAIQEQLA